MFDSQLYEFLKKISSLIKEMKDFGLIYKFFDFYQEKEYNYGRLDCFWNNGRISFFIKKRNITMIVY